jgi:hypothetical protein
VFQTDQATDGADFSNRRHLLQGPHSASGQLSSLLRTGLDDAKAMAGDEPDAPEGNVEDRAMPASHAAITLVEDQLSASSFPSA